MGFLRAACVALLRQRPLGRLLAAAIVVFPALTIISCNNGNGVFYRIGPSHNAYVTLPGSGNILLLSIDNSTGAITLGAQTPQVAGTSPNGLALLASKKLLYVANAEASSISIFTIASDGT